MVNCDSVTIKNIYFHLFIKLNRFLTSLGTIYDCICLPAYINCVVGIFTSAVLLVTVFYVFF